MTDAATAWINDHVEEPQFYCNALVVESRYARETIEEMQRWTGGRVRRSGPHYLARSLGMRSTNPAPNPSQTKAISKRVIVTSEK